MFNIANNHSHSGLLANMRSVMNKVSELQAMIDTYNPSFVMLTETWLKPYVPNSFFADCSQYNVIRRDRNVGAGGGVCVLIDSKYDVVQIDTDPNVELVAFDVMFSVNKFRFIVVYRKPEYNTCAHLYMESLLACLRDLCSVNYTVLLTGDLNLLSVDWQRMLSKAQSPDDLQSKFVDFAQEFGFTQYVTEPTRGENVLDILLVNDPCVITDCNVFDPIGNSDHHAVHFNMQLPTSNCAKAQTTDDCDYVYDFENTDFESFRSFLNSVCWFDVMAQNNSINECWDNFMSVINYGISMFTPLKKVSFSQNKKKYPLYIRQLLRKKSAAWRQYKRFNTEELKSKYYVMRQKCSTKINDYVRRKEDRIITSNNLGLFYRHINKKLVSKTGIGVLKDSSGSYVYRDDMKAQG